MLCMLTSLSQHLCSIQLSIDQNLGEKNPDKIQGIIDTVQIQLLRWCAGGAVEAKETKLTKEQSKELL